MSYKVRYEEDNKTEYSARSLLIIEDNERVETYSDAGEPEDQSFYRDWNWVLGELEKAYAAGLRDATLPK